MGCYVAECMKGCDFCNHTKTFPAPLIGKLMSNHVPNCHWKVISVDLITQSHGYDAIMVVVDCLSKCAHAIWMTLDIMASRVA